MSPPKAERTPKHQKDFDPKFLWWFVLGAVTEYGQATRLTPVETHALVLKCHSSSWEYLRGRKTLEGLSDEEVTIALSAMRAFGRQ